jgi:hypothetical protein
MFRLNSKGRFRAIQKQASPGTRVEPTSPSVPTHALGTLGKCKNLEPHFAPANVSCWAPESWDLGSQKCGLSRVYAGNRLSRPSGGRNFSTLWKFAQLVFSLFFTWSAALFANSSFTTRPVFRAIPRFRSSAADQTWPFGEAGRITSAVG